MDWGFLVISVVLIAIAIFNLSDKLKKKSYAELVFEEAKLRELRLGRKLTPKEVAEVETLIKSKLKKERLKEKSKNKKNKIIFFIAGLSLVVVFIIVLVIVMKELN